MAASVDTSAALPQVPLETAVDPPPASEADSQPPIATKLLTESRPVNTKSSKPPTEDHKLGQSQASPEDKDSEEAGLPKTKIFDNKKFVEAPLPKTNPWGKPAAPAPVPGTFCFFFSKNVLVD